MSFGLAVHSWRTLPIDSAAPAPSDGALEQLRVETDVLVNHSQNVRGLLAAGANGKIMWHAGGDLSADSTIFFSDDGGDTWTDQGISLPDIPNNADSYISNLQYYEPDDTWYIVALDLSVRSTYAFYSTNDGASWTRATLNNGSLSLYRHGLGMDVSDGDWFIAGRGTNNDGTFALKSSPTSTPSILQHVQPSTAYGSVKMGGKYYVKNRSSSAAASSQYITVLDFGENTVETYANWAESTYSTLAFSESDGTRFFCQKGDPLNDEVVTLGVFTPATDYSDPGSEDEITLTYPERVRYCDTVYGNGWISIAIPYPGEEKRYIYVHYSADGVNWSSSPVKFTLPSGLDYGLDDDESVWRAKWGGGSTWYLAGAAEDTGGPDNDRPGIWRFRINPTGGTFPPPPFSHPLYDTLSSFNPDILVRLDDEAGSATVKDDGSKGYTNTVEGSVTFESAGIVGDGGTAATFDDSDASIEFANASYTTHTHVLVFNAPATTAITMVETPSYAIVTDASGNILFRDSLGNETDLLIDEDDGKAILVQVNDQSVRAWKISSYERTADFAASINIGAGTLSIGGAGNVIDYYALITNGNTKIEDLQEALADEFGITLTRPTPPPAPPTADTILVNDLEGTAAMRARPDGSYPGDFIVWEFRHEDQGPFAPIQRHLYAPHSPLPTNPFDRSLPFNIPRTSADSKFGTYSLFVPSSNNVTQGAHDVRSPYSLVNGLVWLRGGTLEAWFKPTRSDYLFIPFSCFNHVIEGGVAKRYGGYGITVSSPSPGVAVLTLRIGAPYGTFGYAAEAAYRFDSFSRGGWNHIATNRAAITDGSAWAMFVNGRRPVSVSAIKGNPDSQGIQSSDPLQLLIGGEMTLSTDASGGPVWRCKTYATYVDAIRIVKSAPIYTNEFSPPTSAPTW